MVAFVRFFGDYLIFSTAEWAFLPSVTNTLVSMDGRLNPGGKVWTGFILMVTGRAILAFAVMVTRSSTS